MEKTKYKLPGRSFDFACGVVELCKALDKRHGVSRTLANQLLRSGTSIGANVEEGQAGQSRADFVSKYSIACKEARETNYWLRLLKETDVIKAPDLDNLIDESNQLIAILTSIIKKAKQNSNKK